MKLELYYPIKPWLLTQGFGGNSELYKEYGIKGHNGLDIFAPNTPPAKVYAAHDGEVVYAGVDSNEGWGVVVRTLEPKEYKEGTAYFKSIYWHMVKEFPVKVGQKVKAGDFIGYADNTGKSTGAHLHFGLKPQARGENDWTWWNLEQGNGFAGAIDPTPYFNGYFAQDSQAILAIYRQIIGLLRSFLKK